HRRRHTRSNRDWSSDVCSSDLLADQMTARNLCRRWADLVPYAARSIRSLAIFGGRRNMDTFGNTINRLNSFGAIKVVSLLKKERSEERRVGKECRRRGG